MTKNISSSATSKTSTSLLYALAENIEFRKAGWQNEAIERAILCTLHESYQGLEINAITARVQRYFGPQDEPDSVDRSIRSLVEARSVSSNKNRYYLTEKTRTKLDEDQLEAIRITEFCENRLTEISKENGTQGLLTWKNFLSYLIVPITTELGTRTFELLRGATPVHDTEAGRKFLDQFKDHEKNSIREAVTSYLDPQVPEVRHHLLGYLTNYSLIAAKGLSEVQIQSLIKISGNVDLDILIDTNVIFSILGLHKNPLNKAVESLFNLRSISSKEVNLNFYALRSTIDEAKQAIEGAMQRAKKITGGPNVFTQIIQEEGYVSGLLSSYLAAKNKHGASVSAYTHFAPYLHGLETMLTNRQVSIVDDEDVRASPGTQERADNWSSFQSGNKTKNKQKLFHDATAVEFVRRKRNGEPKTAVTARWWFVTLDLSLQTLERKDLAGTRRLRTTITPDELTHLMSFWIPRTSSMDSALVGAIRMPFAFYSYDPAIEKIVEKVWPIVSTYEGIDDLGPDDAIRILHDQEVRESLTGTDFEADSEVFVTAIKRVDMVHSREVERLREENDHLQQQLHEDAQRDKVGSSAGKVKVEKILRERDKYKQQRDDLQNRLDGQRTSDKGLVGPEDKLIERLKAIARNRANRRIILLRKSIYSILLLLLILILLSKVFNWNAIIEDILFWITFASILCSICSWLPPARESYIQSLERKIEANLLRDTDNVSEYQK